MDNYERSPRAVVEGILTAIALAVGGLLFGLIAILAVAA